MSKLSEYLEMIRAGIKNPDKIVEGVLNSVKLEHGNLPEDEQAEILRRRLICHSCPYMSSNAVATPALNYKTDRFDEHCILCKCTIKYKTSSLTSQCGISIWNRNNPNHQMPIKWDVYSKK